MKVAIATDTNSSLTGKEAAQLGVYLLPMPVMVDGRACLEGIDITNEQLYAAMKEHKEVFSSQPSPGQLLDFWQGIFRDGLGRGGVHPHVQRVEQLLQHRHPAGQNLRGQGLRGG